MTARRDVARVSLLSSSMHTVHVLATLVGQGWVGQVRLMFVLILTIPKCFPTIKVLQHRATHIVMVIEQCQQKN